MSNNKFIPSLKPIEEEYYKKIKYPKIILKNPIKRYSNSIKLPLLNIPSAFSKMKQYKVPSVKKFRKRREITEEEEEKRVDDFIEKFSLNKSENKEEQKKEKKEQIFNFNSYMKLQQKADFKFKPKLGDDSLELINYIKKVSPIRNKLMNEVLDQIKNTENRYNSEKPEVDSNFVSKNKILVDNRWKNSFSLGEYQQFYIRNLKGKLSNMNYRQMTKKFRLISLMCFSEGNNNMTLIKRLNAEE